MDYVVDNNDAMPDVMKKHRRKVYLRIAAGVILAIGAIIIIATLVADLFSKDDGAAARSLLLATQTPDLSTATPQPSATPTVAVESATPTPQVATGCVVWAQASTGAYLYRQPAKDIVRVVENSSVLMLPSSEQQQESGGITWILIVHNSQEFWIDGNNLHCLNTLPDYAVSGEQGGNLRDVPAGKLITTLTYGTPLYTIETKTENGQEWTKIRLLDGTEGWIVSRLIEPIQAQE